jgi:enhancing lycopene biosynthesis protein 2
MSEKFPARHRDRDFHSHGAWCPEVYGYASPSHKVGLPAEFFCVAPAMEDRERQKACVRSQ